MNIDPMIEPGALHLWGMWLTHAALPGGVQLLGSDPLQQFPALADAAAFVISRSF